MTTVPVPGGEAVLRDPRALTVRQKRPIKLIMEQIGMVRLRDIILAQSISPPEDVDLTDAEAEAFARDKAAGLDALQLTRAELTLLYEMNDAGIWALLAEWWDTDETGQRTVEHPVPRSVDEVQDLPDAMYDVLGAECAKLQAEDILRNGFDLDSIEDPDSPTGASEGSQTPSEAAPSAASTEPGVLPGGSTATAPSSVV